MGGSRKIFDDLAAQVSAGQHEPSITSVCDEETEQDGAWQHLASELSIDLTESDIETHKEKIKSYIRDLVKRGDLGGLSSQQEIISYDSLAVKPPEASIKIKHPTASLANLVKVAGKPMLEVIVTLLNLLY